MLIDTSAAGIKRGKMLWGAAPLHGFSILGTIRSAGDQGEEALLLSLATGITVAGNTGVIRTLPPTVLACLRCGHSWSPRSDQLPRNCPGCNSPYWNRPRR